ADVGADRQVVVDVVEAVQRQAELLEVVGALDARGGLAHLLDGGEQQADEDGDDRDDDEQLDQRERDPPAGRNSTHVKTPSGIGIRDNGSTIFSGKPRSYLRLICNGCSSFVPAAISTFRGEVCGFS